ncbi:6'''-hydroxyparomomycin C oxidase [compost metagenome]
MLSSRDVLNSGFDVCVVGAGPVGVCIAITLSQAGVRTLLLERGARNAIPPKRREGVRLDDTVPHAPDHDTLAFGLGGTSSRWGGRCVELDDIDFEHRDYLGEDARWPISHSELEPHYVEAAKLMKAPRPHNTPLANEAFLESMESWAFPRNTATANRSALLSSKSLHILLDAQLIKLNFDSATGRTTSAAIRCDKQLGTVHANHFVLACGGRENSRLLLNLQAQFPDLFAGKEGPLGRYYMGHLTGQIAQIRFQSEAIAEQFFFRRQQDGRFTRRRLQPSPQTQRNLGVLNTVMWPHNSDVGKLPPRQPLASAVFLREVLQGKRSASRQDCITHGMYLMRHPINGLASISKVAHERYFYGLPHLQMRDVHNEYSLTYHAEQAPRRLSRVGLINDADRDGQFGISTEFSYCPEDYESVLKIHHSFDEWLRAAGLGSLRFLEGDLEEMVISQAHDGYHQIGLTRMGTNRREGVVDADCRAFDIDNLFVAGSSVFPTSGQANPTFPAVAFGIRLAHHLVQIVGRVQPARTA